MPEEDFVREVGCRGSAEVAPRKRSSQSCKHEETNKRISLSALSFAAALSCFSLYILFRVLSFRVCEAVAGRSRVKA